MLMQLNSEPNGDDDKNKKDELWWWAKIWNNSLMDCTSIYWYRKIVRLWSRVMKRNDVGTVQRNHHMSRKPYRFWNFVAVAQIPKERATVVDLRHTGYRLFVFWLSHTFRFTPQVMTCHSIL
jgi:hypothetical protein